MNTSQIDALSDMFDGEPVHPDLLRDALADPSATATLLDFAKWRWDMRQDARRPTTHLYDAMEPVLRPPRGRRWTRFVLPASMTATLLVALAVFGWVTWRPAPGPVPPSPPVTRPAVSVNVSPAERPEVSLRVQPQAPQHPVARDARPRRQAGGTRTVRFGAWHDVLPQ